MTLLEVILIAIGLSMDAFAVSITLGLSVQKPTLKEIIIPGLYFGIFQALMPAIGYFAGLYFTNKIQSLDHWIAFVLLGFIGGKMIKDSFSKETGKNETDKDQTDTNQANKTEAKAYPFQFAKMIVLAIATSIDALAVGITFAFFMINIFKAILITGITTFIIATCGVKIGNIFGIKFKSKAELAGGIILILLGIKIVIEHLFFT
jgi:putative Mn2+ efflux pump MntP